MKIEVTPSPAEIIIPAREMPENSIGKLVHAPVYLIRSQSTDELLRVWPHDSGNSFASISMKDVSEGWKVQLLPKGTKISFTSER